MGRASTLKNTPSTKRFPKMKHDHFGISAAQASQRKYLKGGTNRVDVPADHPTSPTTWVPQGCVLTPPGTRQEQFPPIDIPLCGRLQDEKKRTPQRNRFFPGNSREKVTIPDVPIDRTAFSVHCSSRNHLKVFFFFSKLGDTKAPSWNNIRESLR